MTFDWYKIINRTEFEALSIPSREVTVVLEGVGQKTVLVTKGKLLSIFYEGVLLSIGVTDANPFAFEGYGIYVDANDDVWLGMEVEE